MDATAAGRPVSDWLLGVFTDPYLLALVALGALVVWMGRGRDEEG